MYLEIYKAWQGMNNLVFTVYFKDEVDIHPCIFFACFVLLLRAVTAAISGIAPSALSVVHSSKINTSSFISNHGGRSSRNNFGDYKRNFKRNSWQCYGQNPSNCRGYGAGLWQPGHHGDNSDIFRRVSVGQIPERTEGKNHVEVNDNALLMNECDRLRYGQYGTSC